MPSLDPTTSKAYWRSFNDLADTPEFRKMVENEFPSQLDAVVDPVSRRRFVQIMGASMALAGLTGCDFIRWPKEKILPFASRPEGRHPGTPVQYATAIELGGVGAGLLVTSYDGRPVKVEGNERHPESLGATSAQAQASVLNLYDPDRSRTVVEGKGEGKPSSWDAFWKQVGPKLKEHVANKGDGLAILSEAVGSPTLSGLREDLERTCPNLKWLEYEADDRDNETGGVAKKILGGSYRTHYDLTRADVIVSLDADLLEGHPAALRLAREFADRRRRMDTTRRSNRLYMAESTFSLTGGMADVRFPAQASEVLSIGLALAAAVVGDESMAGKTSEALKTKLLGFKAAKDSPWKAFVDQAAKDLLAAERRGGTVVAVGARQHSLLHGVAHLLNGLLGNVGSTVRYTKAPERPSYLAAIEELKKAKDVKTLLILGANPKLTAPADLEFGKVLDGIGLTVHLGDYRDETGAACSWHLPRAHYLESWGDTRAYDGTPSLIQPLIRPLFGGLTAIELVARGLLGKTGADGEGYTLVRKHWAKAWKGAGEFEALWRRALHDGVIAGGAKADAPKERKDGELLKVLEAVPAKPTRASKDALELVLRRGKLYDGRFANNSWLQELPEPITKLTWDNAVWLSPETAAELGGVKEGDLVTLSAKVGEKETSLEVAAFVVPGLPKFSLSLALGYGRGAEAGVVAKGAGFNAYTLRGTGGLHVVTGVKLSNTGKRYELSTTQDHHSILTETSIKERDKRAGELIREGSLTKFTKHPKFAKNKWEGGDFGPGGPDPQKTLLWKEPQEFKGRRWGMAIDLSVCTGCSACVVACQAENNIPVVGKSEVARGREMHWLRIDRYFTHKPLDAAHGHGDDHHGEEQQAPIRVVHQPMPCQQCENAPCESVCPVAATTHSEEGLNDMAYNRCIGTRYCSNNCPYKVRRFNYFYNHHGPFHPRSEPSPGSDNYPKLPADSPLAIGPLEDAKRITKLEQMAMNPEVSVRSRGVMEKCTYCVQRIKKVTIPADNEQKKIPDGAIRTACQQVCPTQAITFGDLNDKDAAVTKLKQLDRDYTILAELNVRARTSYLAKIRNTPEGMA